VGCIVSNVGDSSHALENANPVPVVEYVVVWTVLLKS